MDLNYEDGMEKYDFMNRLTKIKQNIVIAYSVYMLFFFVFFCGSSFFNIVYVKRAAYLIGTTFFILAEMILFLISRFKGYRPKVYSTDLIIVALFFSFIISTSFSLNKDEAIWGYSAKGTGLLVYECGLVAMLFIRRYFVWSELLEKIVFAGMGIEFILQILNRFNIDPLNMCSSLAESDKGIYLGTLGHINYAASYDSLMLALLIIYFLSTNNKDSRIFCGMNIFLGFMAGICCCSDGFYLGVITSFVVAVGFCIHEIKAVKYLYIEFMLFMIGCAILSCACWLSGIEFWGISKKLIHIEGIITFIAMLPVVILIHFFRRAISLKSYISILGTLIIVAIIFLVIVNINPELINENSFLSILYFDQSWGNYRGGIYVNSILLWIQSDFNHKLWGYGFNTVYDALQSRNLGIVNNQNICDAHNIILNSLITSGLVGTVLWGFLIRCGLRRLMGISFVLVFLAQGIVNGPQIITTPIVLFMFGVILAE